MRALGASLSNFTLRRDDLISLGYLLLACHHDDIGYWFIVQQWITMHRQHRRTKHHEIIGQTIHRYARALLRILRVHFIQQ
jgi:hypothetical protein